MRVGFIGLGTMGAPAARNILRRGFPLVVHDIREEAAGPLIEFGRGMGKRPRRRSLPGGHGRDDGLWAEGG